MPRMEIVHLAGKRVACLDFSGIQREDDGLAAIAPAGMVLAGAEGLTAHAASMAIRVRPAGAKPRRRRAA